MAYTHKRDKCPVGLAPNVTCLHALFLERELGQNQFREEGLILTVRLSTGYRIAAQSTPSGPISESVKEVQRSLRPLRGGMPYCE